MEIGPSDTLGEMPSPLHGNINPAQWDYIRSKFRKAGSDAMLMSCGGECGACLCLGIFCVFFCHPCIYKMVKTQTVEAACREINRTMFGNRLVFHSVDDRVFLNPELVRNPSNSPNQYPSGGIVHAQATGVVMGQPVCHPVVQTAQIVQPPASAYGYPTTMPQNQQAYNTQYAPNNAPVQYSK